MLKMIIKREFISNLMNLRFSFGLLLTVILTIACVVILTHQYVQELDDYSARKTLADDFLDNYAHTNRIGGMITPQKPPEIFRPFIGGIQWNTEIRSFNEDPLPVLFPQFDFLFIVTIIMSLMALLFSYDAVTRERESGTLKLMTANPVSRATIIIGKWLGGMACLLVPLFISLAIGLIYITLHPLVHWDSGAWQTFFLLVIVSVTFVSVFYLLGLLVSASSHHSSTSILTSLFIWVLLVLVAPNLSPYIVAQVYRIPSVNKIIHESMKIQGIDRDNLGRELSGKVTQRFEQEYGQMFIEYRALSNTEKRQRVLQDPALKAMHEAYTKETGDAWNEANRIQREKRNKLEKVLNTRAEKQMIFSLLGTCLTPYADFLYAATNLTGTGFRSFIYFQNISSQYGSAYYDYQQKKVEEARKKDPTFDSNTYLDIRDRPRFIFKEEPIMDRVEAVLPYWGILFFFNVLFFVGAFVKFMRYDVR